MMGPISNSTSAKSVNNPELAATALWANGGNYPRTNSSNSSGFFEEDEPLNPYQTPPQSPESSAHVPVGLRRHIVRMFSSEDASGTSAVAIDNKIEQAMDLVKSHLMIAVREEVEVLKEKISELMDKINQLEVENTILKANMSQETLQQLQMQTQLQIAGSGAATASNMIAAPPATQQQVQPQNVAAITNNTAAAPTSAVATPTGAGATQVAAAPAAAPLTNETALDNAIDAAAQQQAVTNTTTTNGPMS